MLHRAIHKFSQRLSYRTPLLVATLVAVNHASSKTQSEKEQKTGFKSFLKKKNSLDDLIQQSQKFCNSALLQEILGMDQITKTTNPKEFFTQILSRELGSMIKTKTLLLDEKTQKKIIQDIFIDINKAVKLDPVEPTPFQVAVTFNGAKALMTYRFARALWQNNQQANALALSSAAFSNYHVNIHPSVQIDPGIYIDHAFGVNIKENTKVGSGTYILHKVNIGSNVTIGKNVFIGAGAKIASNTTIGDNAMIGAGSHVIADVAKGQTVFGIYDQGGSHKIVPSERFMQVPEDMIEYCQFIQRYNDHFAQEKSVSDIIRSLKSLIPFNPNSHLTVKNLENLYTEIFEALNEKERKTGKLVLDAIKISCKAWEKSQLDTIPEDERITHRNFALWLQGRIATLFKVDVHPAAQLAENIRFPNTIKQGIVIGATASVGHNTFIADGVTLGSDGKETGDRHPKIGNNCYIGQGSSILGAGTLSSGSILMPNTIKPLPKKSKTPEGRVYAGRPAIDMTKACNDKPKCKALLDTLNKPAAQ